MRAEQLSGLDDAIAGLRSQVEQLSGPAVEVLTKLAEELERLRVVLLASEVFA